MKNSISTLFQDRLVRQGSLVSVILLLLSIVGMLLVMDHLQPVVPLFNQAQLATARLASKQMLFLPIFIALIYTILSIVLARIFNVSMPLVGRILIISSLLSTILTFIFLLRTFQLII